MDEQIQKNARIAGALYLAIIVTSILALFLFDSRYIVNGRPLMTVDNIIRGNFFLRFSTAYNFLMYIAVILLSGFLLSLFSGKERKLAMIAHSFRLAEAIMGGISVFCYLILLLLTDDRELLRHLDQEQIRGIGMLLFGAYDRAVIVVFGFMGWGSVIYFYLFFRTGLIPRGIAVWGMISFGLTTTGSFISILFLNRAYMIIGSQSIVFEIFIGCWLLFKGIKVKKIEE